MNKKERDLVENSQCPFCKSHQIEGDHVHVEAGEAWQEVSCLDCDRIWSEIYTLSYIEEIEP